eukprot:CAMPEP_0198220044 /NCGR_PEP_ID=MMETSP1445-20131203/77299_1 /TAXON_ID=36898 /ORGANISM="Pyramimonas sp., Strain CCMP2087" /LENGTH=108 /DNA_ID=CAMNT_0043897669 /DNA_START=326 /DNA_END=648 /DNA_ORIENTATION=+
MEEIEAAIDRLNNMEEVDEAELAALEAEIEQRIQALEDENKALRGDISPEDLKKLEGTSGQTLHKTEKGWEMLGGVSDWIRTKSTSQSDFGATPPETQDHKPKEPTPP